MMIPSSDIAFSPTTKAIQAKHGSRDAYARMEARGGFRTEIDDRLAGALTEANSAYLVTASAIGQPYAQHRGGPRGFIRIVDEHTIGFADLPGNQQFITTGNLAENPHAFLFLMDYAHRRRVKAWGRARVVEPDPGLVSRLMPDGEQAEPIGVILFEVLAWDTNCPQHIPQKLDADVVAAALAERDAEIVRLRTELAALRGASGDAE
ncbi:pyridoxamine 5'-phosphate oxidase family protein [Sphingomonas sp. CARO-RG-8B-R24-01]|uniref:pyridoxamine 5'-phosphate oxidase family protein n=1 Tax=Sphingomonas sp. CARO-RG-8B-R24-01 TaxID=2914831 RepID=UPI001F57C853|nr:pyridoxamine 5'-phosphate oxidase family protein [Sphingomonas sp. CARO-RG-8B-R24-01]